MRYNVLLLVIALLLVSLSSAYQSKAPTGGSGATGCPITKMRNLKAKLLGTSSSNPPALTPRPACDTAMRCTSKSAFKCAKSAVTSACSTNASSSFCSSSSSSSSSSPSSAKQAPLKKMPATTFDLAVAGALSTMIGDSVMHPIDCIKTLQQSAGNGHLSLFGAAATILKQQGIGGFYQGLGTYVLSDGLAGSIKFATFELLKGAITSREKRLDAQATAEGKKRAPTSGGRLVFLAAGLAFIASSVVLVPGELLKQRLQMGQVTSVSQGIKQIWKESGPLGFYKGYTAVCSRDIPYTMLELGMYDTLKGALVKYKMARAKRLGKTQDGVTVTQADEIAFAAITGGIVGYLTNPLDSIKTKVMTSPHLYGGGSILTAAAMQFRDEGFCSFFAGGAARVGYILPFTAIYLPIYDALKRFAEARRTAQANKAAACGANKCSGAKTCGAK